MSQQFGGWNKVAEKLSALADSRAIELNDGQAASLRALAKRLPNNGVIIADEVGMGKTRIAAAVANAVIAAGGRVAILVPPGLGYQWNDELRNAEVDAPLILRSFWQYLRAWEVEGNFAPWFHESALVISHAFANWRLSENAAPWRWALLPAIYARWRKLSYGRWPRGYYGNEILDEDCVRQAAKSIVDAISASPEGCPVRKFIHELNENTPWPSALTAGEYGRDERLRSWLERAVGLGMGVFDLIIIDEAHKSRGHDSGLNRLLTEIILKSDIVRCLAMTATPVELDATQWTQMLERIHVGETAKNGATSAISEYVQDVIRVRQCPNDKALRENYKESANKFKEKLTPFLLRRDKRQEVAIEKFCEISGEGHHAYRREQEILVDTVKLENPKWQQAVCAAEALSFVARQSDNSAAKRLRLTLGNGHGIAALIDQLQRDDKDDNKQIEADGVSDKPSQSDNELSPFAKKRLQRLEWWQSVMIQPFKDSDSALFDHPAILAAVEEIERVCRKEEKVLVFGRFTRPLRALVQLLNAREMLRCLDENRSWPQSKVHENDGWEAVLAAHRQLQRKGELKRDVLDNALAGQYQALENQRRNIREKLIDYIEKGFKNKQPDRRVRTIFDAFKKMTTEGSRQVQGFDDHVLAIMARAMHELIGTSIENAEPTDFARAFIELISASSDRDEGDTNGDGILDIKEASVLWNDLKDRFFEEYSLQEGGYARLLYGETKPATRRFLQLAFNRKQVHPKVLVAQSLVGREGLNLHEACRTVVLLHPEWNPGVVEQQIGRVDRIGSLWEEKLNQIALDKQATDDVPRIEIRPVVFQGTYDEQNWRVLRERWDDLRAQLHGVVISPRIAEKYSNSEDLVNEINGAAPNFSPEAPNM